MIGNVDVMHSMSKLGEAPYENLVTRNGRLRDQATSLHKQSRKLVKTHAFLTVLLVFY